MAIQLSFWTNGYMGHGYSAFVLGVGSAGRQALVTLDLPMYCDDTLSLARTVYINDDGAIRWGGASDVPDYVESDTAGEWLSTREKDDPLYPCRTCDWIFVLADLQEEGAVEVIRKCAEAHKQQRNGEKKFIGVTYAADEADAKKALGDICDLLIFTDKGPAHLIRPIELVLFDMYGGLVTLMDKRDVVHILDKCQTMYHFHADCGTWEEAEIALESIKARIQEVKKGENAIHAIVAGKGQSNTGEFVSVASEAAEYLWGENDMAVFQIRLTGKPIRPFVSFLYGTAPLGEKSMLQAMNLLYEELKKDHPGEEEIEISAGK